MKSISIVGILLVVLARWPWLTRELRTRSTKTCWISGRFTLRRTGKSEFLSLRYLEAWRWLEGLLS